MIVYLANKTQFREKPHAKGAQASCLFLEDEQATDPKATGRMPMLLSNLFVGSGAFTETHSNTFRGLIDASTIST